MRTLPGQLIRRLSANGTMRVGTMRMMPSGSSCRRPRVKTKLLRMSSLQSRNRSPMPTSRAAVIGQCFSMIAESGPPSTTNPSRRMVCTLPPQTWVLLVEVPVDGGVLRARRFEHARRAQPGHAAADDDDP